MNYISTDYMEVSVLLLVEKIEEKCLLDFVVCDI